MGAVVELRQPASRDHRWTTSTAETKPKGRWLPIADPDLPRSSSLVLASFVRRLAEEVDDEGRQLLELYLPRLVGTAGVDCERRHAWLCIDWLARTHAPAWLLAAGDARGAAELRTLPVVRDRKTLAAAARVLDALYVEDDATWDPPCAAAGDPAWDAAWSISWDVARHTAWDGPFNAAWDAARAAARVAGGAALAVIFGRLRPATRDAAFKALGAVGFDAARERAEVVAGDYDTKYTAAADAAAAALNAGIARELRPLLERLETSALRLLFEMTIV